jgi:hypothetical protein
MVKPMVRYLAAGVLLATGIAALAAHKAAAQSSAPSQLDVQAVYLFDFAKFVRWPEGAEHGTLTICVDGEKAYVDRLTRLVKSEQIDSRPLAVRAVQTPADVAGCDILFLSVSAKDQEAAMLAATTGKPILTVSDIPGFLDSGGMIQFLLINKRVRFSVDLRPAAHNGIALSSELLKVAVKVNGAGGDTP